MAKQVNIEITADSSKVAKATQQASKSLAGLDKGAQKATKGMGGMVLAGSALGTVIGTVLSHAFSALGNNIDGAVKRMDALNNFPKVMANMGIGASEAEQAMKVLQDKLVGLPTALDSASLSVQRLTSANGNLKASTAIFLALNNAMLAGGAPMQMQADAMEQVSQAYTKGRFDAMEWRAMMSAMPAQLKQVATALGYTSTAIGGDMQTALTNGTLSMNDFMATFVQLNKEGTAGFPSFAEQAKNSTNGVGTSLVNLKTAFVRGMADIMNAIGQSNIASFFNGIAHAIGTVSSYLVGFVKVAVSAVTAVAGLFGAKANAGAGATAKSVAQTDKAMSGVAKNAGAVGGGLAGANKQAKALSKQLAGFDEMNVLTDKSSAGAGGGGGVSAGGGAGAIDIDTSGMFDGLDKGVSKADEVANKIKGAFERTFSSLKDSPAFQGFEELFNGIASNAKETLIAVAPYVSEGWENLKGTFSSIWTDMSETANEKLPELTAKFQEFFDSVHNIFLPYTELIGSIWSGFTDSLQKFWNEHGKNILDGIADFFIKTQEIFNKIQTEIIEPIVKPALEKFKTLWEETLKPTIDNVADFVGKLIEFGLKIYNEFIAPVIMWLVEKIAPVVTTVANKVVDVVVWLVEKVSGLVNGIIGVFNGILDFLNNTFKGGWEGLWNNIKSFFSAIAEGIGNAFKAPLNWIIDGINGFIRGLNKIQIPDWVPAVGGKGFHISEIPRLARGGVVDGATLALVGESGKEAVMPLERNTGWLDELADKLTQRTGTNSNAPIELVVKVGEDTLVDKIIQGINQQTFMQGSSVINI